MFFSSKPYHKFAWAKWLSGLLVLTALFVTPGSSFANTTSLRATKVHGELAKGYSKHYLALEPTLHDATITLTLNIEPEDKRRVANKVNFLLLTEDALRRVEAGEKPEDMSFGAGQPSVVDHDTAPKQIFNKTTSFKASGQGVYTIIVYSRAPIPTSYTLSAENAEIIDEGGQVTAAE
jgi:hypothetical protein